MITLDITPVATPRPRVTKFATYYPPKYTHYKKALKLLIRCSRKKHLEGAVALKVCFFMPIPKSTPKKKCKALENQPHLKKPDIDNVLKGLLDAMNNELFDDDSQVYEVSAVKLYSANPRIEFELISDPEKNAK